MRIQSQTPPIHKFDGEDDCTVYMARYYNKGTQAIVIVAVVHDRGDNRGDWASYMAGMPGGEYPSYEASMIYAARHGAKLMEEDARFYFNDESVRDDWPSRLRYRQ